MPFRRICPLRSRCPRVHALHRRARRPPRPFWSCARTAASCATGTRPAPDVTFPAVRSAADQRRSERDRDAGAPSAAPWSASSSGCAPRARSTTRPTPSAAPPTRTPSARSRSSAARARSRSARSSATLDDVAARGQLDRLPAGAAVPDAGAQPRVVDEGPAADLAARASASTAREIVWQYFPGDGLQIHPLANFGKLNALWSLATDDDRARRRPIDELLPLAAERAGGARVGVLLRLRRRRPPWVSSLAQGTALQSLARAATQLERQDEVFAGHEPRPEDLRDARRRRACASRPAPARTTRSTPSSPGCGSSTASSSRWSASTTTGAWPADDAREGAVRDRRGARPRGGADLRHRRLVAVLARDRHARVRPRLPHAAARLPDARSATARRADVYCDAEEHFTAT